MIPSRSVPIDTCESADFDDMNADVNDFMLNRFVCHIKGTDQGYSRFIHEQSKG
jgi:hypothetical protein